MSEPNDFLMMIVSFAVATGALEAVMNYLLSTPPFKAAGSFLSNCISTPVQWLSNLNSKIFSRMNKRSRYW